MIRGETNRWKTKKENKMIPVKQQLIIRHVLAHPIRDSALQSELHRGSHHFQVLRKITKIDPGARSEIWPETGSTISSQIVS